MHMHKNRNVAMSLGSRKINSNYYRIFRELKRKWGMVVNISCCGNVKWLAGGNRMCMHCGILLVLL